jgi:uncharacterized protein YkwD
MHSNIMMLAHTNDYRVTPMTLDGRLCEAAQSHARWMAKYSRMSHRGIQFSRPADRVKLAGYNFIAVAENVASGQINEEAVVDAWYASPGHRRNMQNVNYTECGFGCAEDGRGRKYWCAVYASPK